MRSENLAGQSQLFLFVESSVKFLDVLILDIVALRRPVYTGDAAERTGNQLPAEEERIVRPLRQIVISPSIRTPPIQQWYPVFLKENNRACGQRDKTDFNIS